MPRQQNSKTDKSATIPVIVAIIGLIGTLGVAYLNYRSAIDIHKLETNQTSLPSGEKNLPTPTSVTEIQTPLPTSTDDKNLPTPTSVTENKVTLVLLDVRHAPASNTETLLAVSNKEFRFAKSSNVEFTLDNIAPYDILIINFSGYTTFTDPPIKRENVQDFTPNEILAIQNYIEQGGSVFIITTSWVWTAYDKKSMEEFPLTSITQNYGIRFSDGPAKDCAKDGEKTVVSNKFFDQQSPLAKNINQVATLDKGAPGFLIVRDPASIIATCNIGINPILATSQPGKGKIAVITHPNFVLTNLSDSNFDNYYLLLNILNWLASES